MCFSSPVHTEGAAANATPNVVAEKGERSEKSSTNVDAIAERYDVDVEVLQSVVSGDREEGLSEHKAH